jgi:hypothetical protein
MLLKTVTATLPLLSSPSFSSNNNVVVTLVVTLIAELSSILQRTCLWLRGFYGPFKAWKNAHDFYSFVYFVKSDGALSLLSISTKGRYHEIMYIFKRSPACTQTMSTVVFFCGLTRSLPLSTFQVLMFIQAVVLKSSCFTKPYF